MAITVTLGGQPFSIPETNDTNYDAALTSYLKALPTAVVQLTGGTQSLTAELDFGTSFGLKALYLKSETANPASAGQVRLAKTDSIKIRNNANAADLALAIDTGDALIFNGANITGNPMLSANTIAAQSITSGATTIVVFGTVETDSDSGYNAGTGRYTIPTGKGGDYFIKGAIAYGTAIVGSVQSMIHKNAASIDIAFKVNTGINETVIASTTLRLVAGDIIDIRTNQNSGGPVALSNAATSLNRFSLKRIPT